MEQVKQILAKKIMVGKFEIPVYVFVIVAVIVLIILTSTGQESSIPDGSGGA